MDIFDTGTLIIRATNLILWVVVAAKVLDRDQSLSRLARRIVITVILFGMACLVVGALVPFGLDGHAASLLYTSFTVYAAILALAMLSTGEPHGLLPMDGDDDDPPREGRQRGETLVIQIDNTITTGTQAPVTESHPDASATGADLDH